MCHISKSDVEFASLHYAVLVMGEVDSEARILNADALRHVKKAFRIFTFDMFEI